MEFEICEPINPGTWDQDSSERRRRKVSVQRASAVKRRQSALFIPESDECRQLG